MLVIHKENITMGKSTKPKPKPKTRPKGYRFPQPLLMAALGGAVALSACDGLKSKPTPDQVLAEVERHACYSRAGLAAEAALKAKCPTVGNETERAFQLVSCASLEALMDELDNQLEKCDE
jgi:hypothetical protein